MKKAISVAAITLALISVGAAKYKAYVDFDRSVDFSAVNTFAYFETIETSIADEAPPVHEMIKILIVNHLKKSGLQEVERDPDVYVTYHTDANQAMRMNTTLYQYHYSANWYWSPLWGSGMDVSSYTRGTLIIDIWKPDTEELIWRGTVLGVVPDNPSPKKAQKVIEDAIEAIGREWRKQYKKAQ
jgi:hypothetical protein